jgi:hypothetical protein
VPSRRRDGGLELGSHRLCSPDRDAMNECLLSYSTAAHLEVPPLGPTPRSRVPFRLHLSLPRPMRSCSEVSPTSQSSSRGVLRLLRGDRERREGRGRGPKSRRIHPLQFIISEYPQSRNRERTSWNSSSDDSREGRAGVEEFRLRRRFDGDSGLFSHLAHVGSRGLS